MKDVLAVCNTLEECERNTNMLDKASLVDLKVIDGGVEKPVDNFKGVYNISQGKLATAVVPYYNLVQHRDYFMGFANALNRLDIEFTMTLKQAGQRAFADIEFENKNIKFDKLNEEFTTGIRLVNSYNKLTGVFVMPRYTRLACTNGMIITRCEKTLSIKHTSKVLNEIEKFIETRLSEIITENSDLQAWVSGAMGDSIEWLAASRIMGKLFKQPKHREEILKRLGISMITVEDKKSKKKSISYVLDDDEKKLNKITRWEMYNAITHYLTHGEHITPHIENHFHKYAEKLLVTPLAKMPTEKVVLNV